MKYSYDSETFLEPATYYCSSDICYLELLGHCGMGGVERRGARQVAPTAAIQDGTDRDAGFQRDAVLHGLKATWKQLSINCSCKYSIGSNGFIIMQGPYRHCSLKLSTKMFQKIDKWGQKFIKKLTNCPIISAIMGTKQTENGHIWWQDSIYRIWIGLQITLYSVHCIGNQVIILTCGVWL